MGRGGIEGRLRRLEERAAARAAASPLDGFPDWDLDDQIDDVLDVLRLHRIVGARGELVTDRQIHVMGIACASWALSAELGEERFAEEGGEHAFPSGAAVSFAPEGDGWRVAAAGPIVLEDLPDGVLEHWERMDPAEQPERELWLYGYREQAKRERELARGRRAWRAEHSLGYGAGRRPITRCPGEGVGANGPMRLHQAFRAKVQG